MALKTPEIHMARLVLFFLSCSFFVNTSLFGQSEPLKIGISGLTHTHVHSILGRENIGDIKIVGIAEPNHELAKKYVDQYGLSMDLVHNSLEEMITAAQPEAVTAFGNIYDHLEVVQICAPKGIHVMVEKPLAVSMEHAKKMKDLAEAHNIHLLTNYETTWYPTNHKAKSLLDNGKIGALRKVIVRDGHRGPVKIGVNKEFLEWLQDPILNGGGAITDFGCYGANLVTWLKKGKRPNTVTAVTQQMQSENNPKVDDDATIILTYDDSQAILEPSWNWPIGRKDMELYGLTGAIYADNGKDLRIRMAKGYDGFQEEKMTLPKRPAPYTDGFSFLAGVVKGSINMAPFDLSSLENNMLVIEILDAARKSAEKGVTIFLEK